MAAPSIKFPTAPPSDKFVHSISIQVVGENRDCLVLGLYPPEAVISVVNSYCAVSQSVSDLKMGFVNFPGHIIILQFVMLHCVRKPPAFILSSNILSKKTVRTVTRMYWCWRTISYINTPTLFSVYTICTGYQTIVVILGILHIINLLIRWYWYDC